MDIGTYIVEKALVLVPALWIIGTIIKKVPVLPDWIIPLVLLAIGIVGSMALVGWDVEGAVQGVLVAGVSVLGNQVVKQIGHAVNDNVDQE